MQLADSTILETLRHLSMGADGTFDCLYALEAMIAGNLTCHIWVDTVDEPNLAYLWDGGYLHFVLGSRTPAAERALIDHIPSLLTRAQAEGVHAFKIALADPSWQGWLPEWPAARILPRQACLLDNARVPQAPPPIPPGYTLCPIDAALLADPTLDTADVQSEIASCWPSIERFLATGFGYAILHKDQAVAWCTAEMMSPGRCGVGIETLEAHQRRGLATAVATAFAQHCLRANLAPLWDAWAENTPSLRTADKTGWVAAEAYEIVFGLLPEV